MALSQYLTVLVIGEDMETALQYLPSEGLPSLVNQLKKFQQKVHSPPETTWKKSDLIVTAGCLDGMAKAIDMTLSIGDGIVVQECISHHP
jgi:kynurenine/2-aminoadipate aminotransferase